MTDDLERAAMFIAEHGLGGGPSEWVHDLQSELGEVAKEVLKASGYGETDPEFDEAIVDEVGDLYFSLLGLMNALDIDPSGALDQVLDKYGDRVTATGAAGSGR